MTDGYCDAIVEAFEKRYDRVLDVTDDAMDLAAEAEQRRNTTYGTDVLDDDDDKGEM